MVICPLCEHAQDRGAECEVCGKQLAGGLAADAPIARLADLEPTRLDGAGEAPAERMPDLEPTLRDAAVAGVFPGYVEPWIERTSHPSEDAPDQDLFAVAVCRYCRSQASPGDVFCARCGLKLAQHSRAARPLRADVRRCRSCGVVGAGEICWSCGARLATEA